MQSVPEPHKQLSRSWPILLLLSVACVLVIESDVQVEVVQQPLSSWQRTMASGQYASTHTFGLKGKR